MSDQDRSPYRLDVAASAPWGEGPSAIAEVSRQAPSFGEVSDDQLRRARVVPSIRLDPSGAIHALSGAALFHFDGGGKLVGRTALPPEATAVTDYAVETGGSIWLLERGAARLRKLDAGGRTVFAKALSHIPRRLLIDGNSRVYLPGADGIDQLDPSTGDSVRHYQPPRLSEQVFMTPDATAVWVLYAEAKGRRGLASFELAGERFQLPEGKDEWHPWLAQPLGVDSSTRLYAWRDGTVGRISLIASIEVIAALDGAVALNNGDIYSSRSQASSVEVTRSGGAPVNLTLPAGFHLVHVDDRMRLYLFGGEQPGRFGSLHVYSKEGALERTSRDPAELASIESALAPIAEWVIDPRGAVLIPMASPRGFQVLRLGSAK